MSEILMEYLLDSYQGAGIFKLNNVDVKMGLKDVAPITTIGEQ